MGSGGRRCPLAVAGTLFPPSYGPSFLAARIDAAISNTPLRPSSTERVSIFVFYSPLCLVEWMREVAGEVGDIGARRQSAFLRGHKGCLRP